jgi:predicted phage terminase large subunit-like protein
MLIPIPAYRSGPTKPGQPYSFSEDDFRGKEADLGPRIYSPLYKGQPIDGTDQMFPPEVWNITDGVSTDDYTLIISAWDTASRTKSTNDPSDNCIVGRTIRGDFIVIDNFECKLTFDKLLPVCLERYRRVGEWFPRVPIFLCIEEADSGKQLVDIIEAQFPGLPLLKARPVQSKIVRAESVTPFTTARSVSLLRGAWNTQFITDMANFPASERDHSVDSFCHSMRAFTGTGGDFQKPKLIASVHDERQQLLEQALLDAEYEDTFGDLIF